MTLHLNLIKFILYFRNILISLKIATAQRVTSYHSNSPSSIILSIHKVENFNELVIATVSRLSIAEIQALLLHF